MQFGAKKDVALPQQVFFDRMADFQMFERVAIQRDVDVTRRGSMASAEGLKWDCTFKYRRRVRKACVHLKTFNAPENMVFSVTNPALDIRLEITFTALSKTQTRFQVSAILKPKTLTARLLVQSMKMTRSKYNQRFQKRVAEVANELVELGAV